MISHTKQEFIKQETIQSLKTKKKIETINFPLSSVRNANFPKNGSARTYQWAENVTADEELDASQNVPERSTLGRPGAHFR